MTNVIIKFLGNNDQDKELIGMDELKYYAEYIDEEVSGELTIFTPNNCDIKYLKIYNLEWDNNKEKLENGDCLKVFKNIKHGTGILLDIYYVEGIPNRKIVWMGDYGVKGEHIFSYNGFNGNIDMTVYNYKFGIINKLRKVIGFK